MKAAAPEGPLCAAGIVTTSDTIVPLASYTVDLPVPSSETQKGLPAPYARPHALTRLGSCTFVTRLVCVNWASALLPAVEIERIVSNIQKAGRRGVVSLVIVGCLLSEFPSAQKIASQPS